MAKLDIDFVLLDESVVQMGFRVLMSGVQLDSFKKNPVMLFMHARAEGGMFAGALEKDAVLPIGKWTDIRIEGDKLLAKPEFDDDDDFAKKIQKKVEKGYLNAASVALEPVAVSDEENLKLQGQRGATVTKSMIGEASIVDMPNCRNALAIRNSAGKKIQLSGGDQDQEALTYLNSLLPQNNNMDKKLLAAKLGLSENATDQEISVKLAAVLSEAGKVSELTTEITQLKGSVTNLQTQLTTANEAAQTAKVEALVDGAIGAKKLAAGDREKYVKLAKADYETTKELIDAMKAYESVEQKLAGGTGGGDLHAAELGELMKLSGRDLYMQGKFERLKELSAEGYKVKYKEYFNVEPK